MTTEAGFDIRGAHYTPLLKRFYSPDVNIPTYKTNKVAVGKDIYTGEAVYMDFNESCVVGVLGRRGSGKSFLTEAIVSRAWQSKIQPCVLTDIKPEYYMLENPVQDKFKTFLNEHESPVGLPMVNFFPKFLEKFNTNIDFTYRPVALTFEDMTLSDFLTFIKADFSRAQMAALEAVFKAKDDKRILNFKEMINFLRRQPEVDDRTISSIKLLLQNLIDYEVVGDQYGVDLLTVLNNEQIPNLILQGWFNLGKFTHYVAADVALFVREILNIKMIHMLKKDKKVLIVVDEATRFCPSEGQMSSKKALLECVDVGRTYGISMITGWQSISRVPQPMLEQMKYILLPFNIDIETAKEVFKRKGLLDVVPSMFEYEVRQIINPLRKYKNGQREWLFVNTDTKEYSTILPFAPLGYHREED